MRRIASLSMILALLVTASLTLGGCVVVPPRGGYYHSAVWVPGHWAGGVWVGGHYR